MLYQGLGDLDLVQNVMLGNSPAPQTGAPVKSSAGGAASLMPFHQAVDEQVAKANAKDAAPDSPGGKKTAKGSANFKQSAASQLTANIVPVILPAVIPQTVVPKLDQQGTTKDSGTEAAGKKKGSTTDLAAGCTTTAPTAQELLAAMVNGAANLAASNRGLPNEAPAKTTPVKSSGKDIVQELVDPESAAEQELPSLAAIQQTTKAQADLAVNEKIQQPTSTKPVSESTAPVVNLKSSQSAQEQRPQVPQPEATRATVQPPNPESSASKAAHAIETLAASAVSVTVKQAIPAQGKLMVPSPTGEMPSPKAAAPNDLATPRSVANNVSAHAAAPVHETQAAHEQAKKQPDVEATPAPAAGNQTQAQINLANRVLSSDSNIDQPREATGPASTSTSSLPKPESALPENLATAAGPVSLNSARLLESLGQSELRVGMKMGDLGNVEIRTQLHHDQLHAEISVERGDLSRTLAAELPALQQRLHEQDMPTAQIVVTHQAAAGSGSFERGSQQQERAFAPMSHVFGIDTPATSFSPDEIRSTETGLDIRI